MQIFYTCYQGRTPIARESETGKVTPPYRDGRLLTNGMERKRATRAILERTKHRTDDKRAIVKKAKEFAIRRPTIKKIDTSNIGVTFDCESTDTHALRNGLLKPPRNRNRNRN